MFKRLKDKWKVGWVQFLLIICTFALGGSLCARLGSWLLHFVVTEKTVLYWIAYLPLVTILWPICVLLISIFFGQYRFFKNYLQRMWSKISKQPSLENSSHETTNNTPLAENKQLPVTKIAIFASGTGTNAQKIIDYFEGSATIQIALIVCNKQGAGVLKVAEASNIPTLMIEKEQFFRGNAYVHELNVAAIDFLVLAGFLWKLPSPLIHHYLGKIVNLHPSLLPKYGGRGMFGNFVHEAVIANKEEETGITIHFVDEEYDHGSIIFQARCQVLAKDTPETLAQKIHLLEHAYYPKTIESVLLRQID